MNKLTLFLAFLSFGLPGFSQQEITGDWYGLLDVQVMKLNVVFHIAQGENGLTATMDSPDQGAKGIPVTETLFSNDSLNLALAQLSATYKGKLLEDQSITGTFTQGVNILPLTLSRQQPDTTQNAVTDEPVKRPQEPKAPFPYLSKEVKFDNTEASVNLAGTLTLPDKTGKFPAVVLITGSGPQDRNEELMGHKPFLVISDYLTRNGIAVLRYDDRGVGESGGQFSGSTSYDFADDAKAAVDYLKTRPEIDATKIGLIGHSEGGMIAPIVASEDKSMGFIVLLAGPGLPIDQMMLLQKKGVEENMGVPEAQVAAGQKIFSGIYDVVKSTAAGEVEAKVRTYLKEQGVIDEAMVQQFVDLFNDPWMQTFLKYDPRSVLEKVTCPVLALNGSKDLQVPATEDLAAIKQALEKGGNKNVTIKEIPGLNHLFQTAETGLPAEYGEIEETFSPQALEIIKDWVLDVVK